MAIRNKLDRIQQKRTKGWRMPANTVYVGRPTKWGNPGPTAGWFRDWLAGNLPDTDEFLASRRQTILSNIGELRGKNLACWCAPGQPCHADVLLELAKEL